MAFPGDLDWRKSMSKVTASMLPTSACLDVATLSFSLSDVTTFAKFVLITKFSLPDEVPNVSP
jgi:hypothetical protein